MSLKKDSSAKLSELVGSMLVMMTNGFICTVKRKTTIVWDVIEALELNELQVL